MPTTTTTTTTTVVQSITTDAEQTARLVFILDRSGSMSNIKNEAIGGFNAFVDEQKKVPGAATLSLVIFDNVIDTIHDNLPLANIPTLTETVYVPRGMTALNDAIGSTINRILALPSPPNEKTIVAILTDGAENSSHEYSGQAVADLIKKVETEFQWEVLFLGANIDVSTVARSYNIQEGKFAQFAASAVGMEDSYATLNASTTAYRSIAKGVASTLNMQADLDARN